MNHWLLHNEFEEERTQRCNKFSY